MLADDYRGARQPFKSNPGAACSTTSSYCFFLDLPSCLKKIKKKKKKSIRCAIQNEGQFRCAEEGETVLFILILACYF